MRTLRIAATALLLVGLLSAAAAESKPSLPESFPQPQLLAAVLDGPMAGVDEIVFAMRQPGKDGHWYANFGYYADDAERLTYGDGGRLCRLHLQSGRLTVLLVVCGAILAAAAGVV